MRAVGSALGTGAMIVMDDPTCMVSVLRRVSRFYHAESCGQCTPCREGTGWLHRLLTRITEGRGRPEDLALLLDVKIRGIAFFRALFFVPHLVPMAMVATLWLFLYEPQRGPINALLGMLGIPGPAWLQSTSWALPAMILVKVWKAVGYYTILFLAGLQGVPQELYDAADELGQ